VFVPVLWLRDLRDGDLGMIAESSEEVGSGERRRLDDVERRETTQSPASLRLRPASETTPHALQRHVTRSAFIIQTKKTCFQDRQTKQ